MTEHDINILINIVFILSLTVYLYTKRQVKKIAEDREKAIKTREQILNDKEDKLQENKCTKCKVCINRMENEL